MKLYTNIKSYRKKSVSYVGEEHEQSGSNGQNWTFFESEVGPETSEGPFWPI